MTWFGWVLTILLILATINSPKNGRIVTLLLLLGVLAVGTGRGLGG